MLRRAALLSSGLTSAGVKNGIIQDDWDTINEICKSGRASEFYNIGDAKEVPVNFTYNNVTYTSLKFHIGNFTADFKSDLSGAANTTWVCSTLITCLLKDNGNYYYLSASDWETSGPRSVVPPLFETFPTNLKNNIEEVIKIHRNANSTRSTYSLDKLWIPTYCEILLMYRTLMNSEENTNGTIKTDFFGKNFTCIALRDSSTWKAGGYTHTTLDETTFLPKSSSSGTTIQGIIFCFCL